MKKLIIGLMVLFPLVVSAEEKEQPKTIEQATTVELKAYLFDLQAQANAISQELQKRGQSAQTHQDKKKKED